MNLTLQREIFTPDFSLGRLYVDNRQFCYTCEDADRHLEDDPDGKVWGKTAIPRGKFRVLVSFSHHFRKIMPEVINVPGFSGVRIHGGNTADDSLGCILVGRVRTADGICQCPDVVTSLTELIEDAIERGEGVTLEVK